MDTIIVDLLVPICANLNAIDITALKSINTRYYTIIGGISTRATIKKQNICVDLIKINDQDHYYFRGQCTSNAYTGRFKFKNPNTPYLMYVVDGKVKCAISCWGTLINSFDVYNSSALMPLYDFINNLFQYVLNLYKAKERLISRSTILRRIFIDKFELVQLYSMEDILASHVIWQLLEQLNRDL